ncbi:MAG: hypothetical protein ACI92G_003945 [Candidatus Pelagisphaera sp.]|jgi:hypothetical protein
MLYFGRFAAASAMPLYLLNSQFNADGDDFHAWNCGVYF